METLLTLLSYLIVLVVIFGCVFIIVGVVQATLFLLFGD
jgi:hypothetical protein